MTEFERAFTALCEWSKLDTDGPGWVTPIKYMGVWRACARPEIGDDEGQVEVEGKDPIEATINLAKSLGLV